MKPQYISLIGTTPKIVQLNNDCVDFNVAIRAPVGVTVEVALEDLYDATENPPSGAPAGGPTWLAVPAAVDGVVTLTSPRRLVRFTPTGDALVTMLQQGVR